MEYLKKKNHYSSPQLFILVLLRIAIGWHFLYEGLAKLFTPNWSSASYLDSSQWILRDFFQWILANERRGEVSADIDKHAFRGLAVKRSVY